MRRRFLVFCCYFLLGAPLRVAASCALLVESVLSRIASQRCGSCAAEMGFSSEEINVACCKEAGRVEKLGAQEFVAQVLDYGGWICRAAFSLDHELRGQKAPSREPLRALAIDALCGFDARAAQAENTRPSDDLVVVGVHHNGLGNTLFQEAGSRLFAKAVNARYARSLIVPSEGALDDKIPPHSFEAWASFPEIFLPQIPNASAKCAPLRPRFAEYRANGTILYADRPGDRKRRKPRQTLQELLTALRHRSSQRLSVSAVHEQQLRCVKFISYFQDYALFRGLMPSLRDWLPLRVDRTLSARPSPLDIVIHVRLCKTHFHSYRYYDLANYFNYILPQMLLEPGGHLRVLSTCDPAKGGVVKDLIDNFGAIHTKPHLVLETKSSRRLQQQRPHTEIMGVPSAPADFLYLAQAKRLIICESTFSWWAAVLSNATEIHAPGSGVVPVAWDDPRFVFHDIGQKRYWGRFKQHQRGTMHYEKIEVLEEDGGKKKQKKTTNTPARRRRRSSR